MKKHSGYSLRALLALLLWDQTLSFHLSQPTLIPRLQIPSSRMLNSCKSGGRCGDKRYFPRPPVQNLKMSVSDEEDLKATDAVNGNDEAHSKSKSSKKPVVERRRKMELGWCGRDSCSVDESIREKVYGDFNQIEFDQPATGQVTYSWKEDSNEVGEGTGDSIHATPSVLILVKRSDDELLKVAADAVRDLTSSGQVTVMLAPEVAAKFKHYFGVDNEKINLFDPPPATGFGGNHLPTSDHLYNPVLEQGLDHNTPIQKGESHPDLICTLGGDGLLMHACTLFSGPCPPILCVAGGSLGFLTPFSRLEMVDAIRASLGVVSDSDDFYWDEFGSGSVWGRNGVDTKPTNDNELIQDPNGLTLLPDSRPNHKTPKFSAGAIPQICLSMRMRLDCRVINKEGVVRARFNVLNEVVIDRGSSPYLAALECFCDNVHLTTVQADGIIFSTPTGSTAYSMAAGGSVVHPAVPAILVTPICPHVLSFRSMVFPDHVVLRCYVPEDARSDAAVAFDGKYRRELHRGDSVQIQMSSYPVPTINKVDHSADWLTSLKRNFNFNTRVRQGPLQ